MAQADRVAVGNSGKQNGRRGRGRGVKRVTEAEARNSKKRWKGGLQGQAFDELSFELRCNSHSAIQFHSTRRPTVPIQALHHVGHHSYRQEAAQGLSALLAHQGMIPSMCTELERVPQCMLVFANHLINLSFCQITEAGPVLQEWLRQL